MRDFDPLCLQLGRRGLALAAPEVPLETRLELLEMAGRHGLTRFCALNSAEIVLPLATRLLENTEYLSINRDEAEAFAGGTFDLRDPETFLAGVHRKIESINPGLRPLVTVGSQGSYGYESGRWEYTPAARVKVASTAGAGDASLGGLIVAIVLGLPFILPERPRRQSLADLPLETAVDFAALLSSLTVTSPDTIHLGTTPALVRRHAETFGIKLGPAMKSLLTG